MVDFCSTLGISFQLPPEYLASMGIELPLKSAPASDLPADSEGKKEAIKVKGKRRGAKGDKVTQLKS